MALNRKQRRYLQHNKRKLEQQLGKEGFKFVQEYGSWTDEQKKAFLAGMITKVQNKKVEIESEEPPHGEDVEVEG